MYVHHNFRYAHFKNKTISNLKEKIFPLALFFFFPQMGSALAGIPRGHGFLYLPMFCAPSNL